MHNPCSEFVSVYHNPYVELSILDVLLDLRTEITYYAGHYEYSEYLLGVLVECSMQSTKLQQPSRYASIMNIVNPVDFSESQKTWTRTMVILREAITSWSTYDKWMTVLGK